MLSRLDPLTRQKRKYKSNLAVFYYGTMDSSEVNLVYRKEGYVMKNRLYLDKLSCKKPEG